MKYNEEEPEDLETNPSLTGPNELNEEDLGLEEDTPNAITEDGTINLMDQSIADNEDDTMEDPDNDLDEEEVGRLFPGSEDLDKDNDIEELNDSV